MSNKCFSILQRSDVTSSAKDQGGVRAVPDKSREPGLVGFDGKYFNRS